MAWYLATGRSPARWMNFPTPLTVNYGTDAYTIEFESAMTSTADSQFIIGQTSVSAVHAIYFTTGGRFQITVNGSTVFFSNVSYGLFDGNFHVYRIEHDAGGALRFYRDGVLFQSRSFTYPDITTVPLNALFRGSSVAAAAIINIKYLEVTGFGAGSDKWDATLSGGTGTVLPTVSGANNATQSGTWPSDDSEWVFYSSGGSFTLSADGGTFAYTGAAASLLANRSLSANGGSFSYSGAAAALRINRLLQADGSSFSYSGASADLLLDRLLSADGGLFSYSGAAATLTYTPITGYVLSADGATFNYFGADAALNYSQNFPEANPNDFTVSSLVDSSFAYTSSISPTVGFSAMISSTFKYNGSLN